MAETALYSQLTKYNEKIQNHYKDNWGSVLAFLGGKDSETLAKKSDEVSRMMRASARDGFLGAAEKSVGEGGRSLFGGSSSRKALLGRSQGHSRRRVKKPAVVISRHAVAGHGSVVDHERGLESRVNPAQMVAERVRL